QILEPGLDLRRDRSTDSYNWSSRIHETMARCSRTFPLRSGFEPWRLHNFEAYSPLDCSGSAWPLWNGRLYHPYTAGPLYLFSDQWKPTEPGIPGFSCIH